MPDARSNKVVIVKDGSSTGADLSNFPPVTGGGTGTLSKEPIALNEDVILVATAQNKSGMHSSDYKAKNYEKSNDRTIYFKVRFTDQTDEMRAKWRNGKIVLE